MHFRLSYPLPLMDVVNVLQTPPIFFRLFVKLALSLFNSTINLSHSKLVHGRPTPSAFDVDARTGFFPPRPLPRLPSGYTIWEAALREASGNLSLGEDESEDALEKRPFGDQWRANIASVRVLLFFFSYSNLTYLVVACSRYYASYGRPPTFPTRTYGSGVARQFLCPLDPPTSRHSGYSA